MMRGSVSRYLEVNLTASANELSMRRTNGEVMSKFGLISIDGHDE